MSCRPPGRKSILLLLKARYTQQRRPPSRHPRRTRKSLSSTGCSKSLRRPTRRRPRLRVANVCSGDIPQAEGASNKHVNKQRKEKKRKAKRNLKQKHQEKTYTLSLEISFFTHAHSHTHAYPSTIYQQMLDTLTLVRSFMLLFYPLLHAFPGSSSSLLELISWKVKKKKKKNASHVLIIGPLMIL